MGDLNAGSHEQLGILIGRLFDAHAAPLALYARQLCEDPEAAVQQAFAKLADQPVCPANPVAWLYRTTRNEALMSSRADRRRRRREIEATHVNYEWFQPSNSGSIDGQAIATAMERLSSEQREIVSARIWGGLSFEDIGTIIGTSASSTHRRYQEALEILRNSLGGL